MQINFRKLVVIGGLFLLALPTVVLASIIRTDANVPQSEVVSGNLYITGSAPVIAGTINGDLVAAGGTLVITGNILQDILVAGGNINISGQTGGDVRAFGGSIYLDGVVTGDVLTAGGDVRFGPNAVIHGDLIANGGTVTLNPATKVYGIKKISNGEDFQKEAGGALREMPAILQTAFLVGQLISILGLLLAAALCFGFFPGVTNRLVYKTLEKGYIWKNIGLGFLMAALLPVAAIICFITGVGVMLGFILLFAFILYILFGIAFSGVIFGGWLYAVTKKPKKPLVTWGALILGIIFLHIISLIPVIGWLVSLVYILLTWGGALRMKLEIISGIK